jgi:hypothetical protein
MLLRKLLPDHHLTADSKDVVKVGAGLIGTMAVLLLGLLIASAKASYDTKRGEITQMAAKVLFLDRILASYGPEASEAREMLRRTLERAIAQIWPGDRSQQAQLDPSTNRSDHFYDILEKLSPANDRQRQLKSYAQATAMEIGQMRWLLLVQRETTVSTPMLATMVFWLAIVFLSFGLFAPPNLTVIVTLFLGALAVTGAIVLVLEFDQPFGGIIEITSTAMQTALEHLGK